jgi:dipeptidyl aminopeptidase/acylaminoacyl peptidase
MTVRAAAFFALFSLACVSLPVRAFDIPDARKVVSLSEPQISPDGTRIVYIRGKADYDKDRTDRQLVLIDVRTHKSRQLTWDRKGLDSPQWSPDGAAIAFSALDGDEDNPQSQIFILRMDGGEAQQITHAKNGVNGFAWSPDGKRFAYTMQEDDPDQKAVDKHLDAFQVHDNDYLHRNATPPVHLWVIDADGSHAKQLTRGDWSVANVDPDGGGDLSWSPNSKWVAFEHFDTPFIGNSLSEYVELADVASGKLTRLTPGEAMQTSPVFAPAGMAVVYSRNAAGDAMNGNDLYVAAPSGKRIADLRSQLDRNVDAYTWSANGSALWVATPDGTGVSLWYWPLHGRIAQVHTGTADLSPGELGNTSKNGTLVFIGANSVHPGEIYTLSAPGAAPVAITDENGWVASRGVARSVGVEWKATKGDYKEDGALTYPLGYDGLHKSDPNRKFPLILLIHGGPQGASGTAWSSQRQEMAAHGFFVFSPNYRGSTNLGDAYQHAIANDTGDGPGKDVMAGLAQVEREFPIDTSRVGVSGWSYGGYMTSWLIGNYHVWKAAVSGASLDDWLDDYNVAFYYDTDVPFFRGKPWNPVNTAEWREQSPITFDVRATTPTLIMGDVGDNNVPITNSYKLYHALKDNGDVVQFVAYPVSGHFPSDPVRSEDITKRWLAWLEQYLK